ncbi:MAG: hypothetical protein CVU72_02760 [Deltaproteobacteria bacterium HGW-Deltaproteobacteria-7]|jgi:hypothetical protein|nr:MAG: hypothetical protein CVU72_02760 [Deltaproteobacteria bacterium HGW-Deltaproteobacteria-7]PKN18174.1 MAG: hypothetical protein CVU71_11710 [Deltaproteobacteria bacterium HGW-Deltaproteobacteria-6]
MKQMERFYFTVKVLAVLCMLVAFSSNVDAAGKNPCKKDIEKFCKNVKPENNGIMRCLEQHERELTKECRDYEVKMEGLKGERREIAKGKMRFRQDCKADINKFCKDADLQPGGIGKCIYQHENVVSASCKAWIKNDKEEIGKAN